MKNNLFRLAFGCLLLTGILHVGGTLYYLYWDFGWFHSLMHFLGGLSVGLMFLWLWYASGAFDKDVPSKREAMIAAVAFSLLVGIGWEMFEYVYGIDHIGGHYMFNVFRGLLWNFCGAVCAGIIGRDKKLYA